MTTFRWSAVLVSAAIPIKSGLVSVAVAADLPGTGADVGRTVVYRDTWGVPHIYTPTVKAGMYAMGWTQAEDRPEEILKNFLRTLGESARFDGPKAIQSDMVSHLWDHYGTSKRYYHRIRPDVRGQIQAFIKGINDFYTTRPDDIPSWWGSSRFWEFRIHAGELHGSGFTLPGVPSIGLGHNADVAWAMTMGGPDIADVYELKLKEDDPAKYLYDGQWRALAQHDITIEAKGLGPKKITIWSSHHGPIVAMLKGKAYAAKIAYADEVQVSEAWHEFNTAKDYRGAAHWA